MNKFKYNIFKLLGFKYLLRRNFEFLKKYSFYEIKGKSPLVIPEWLKRGISYTDDKWVIVFTDDIRESRFETIIYKIQDDYRIPIDTDYYFTLEDFINKEKMHSINIAHYSPKEGIKVSIETAVKYLKRNINKIRNYNL